MAILGSSSKKVLAGGAAALAAAGLVVAKNVGRGADDAVRASDGLGSKVDDLTPGPVDDITPGPGGPEAYVPPPEPPAVQVQETAVDVLCDQLGLIATSQDPGEFSAEGLLTSVARSVGGQLPGAEPLAVWNAVDQLETTMGISGTIGPSQAQAYLRACPPI